MGNGFKKGLKRMITFTVAGAMIIQSSFAGFAPYERTYANDVNELEEKSQVIQVDDTVSVTVSSEEPYAYFSFTPEETNLSDTHTQSWANCATNEEIKPTCKYDTVLSLIFFILK